MPPFVYIPESASGYPNGIGIFKYYITEEFEIKTILIFGCRQRWPTLKPKPTEGEVMGVDEKMPLEAESENTINEMALSKQELENKALSTADKALKELNDFMFLRLADARTVERLTSIVANAAALLKELRLRKG